MAVRNDFTAGEVLAAADLNDTFASKQADVMTTKGDLAAYGTAVARLGVGTNGQVLTADSGETLGIKWADAAGGLTLISTESFTSVSSVSVNNAFSATYRNYRLLLNIAASTGDIHTMRMRVGGSDETGSVYFWARQFFNTTTSTIQGSSGDTEFDLYYGDTSTAGQIEVMSPFSTLTKTHIYTTGGNADNDVSRGGGNTSGTTSYDGFTITAASGTITGTIRIYGYKD